MRIDRVASLEAEAEKFIDLVRKTDPETRSMLALMVYALEHGQHEIADGLEAFGRETDKQVFEREIRDPDYDLLALLMCTCSKEEIVWWLRSVLYAHRRGDTSKMDALEALINERIANWILSP